jgi:hypothetical protein
MNFLGRNIQKLSRICNIKMDNNVKSVREIYSEFIKKYPDLDLKLASGGLEDAKGPNTSDVDISLYC